jgi:hypothetical protein
VVPVPHYTAATDLVAEIYRIREVEKIETKCLLPIANSLDGSRAEKDSRYSMSEAFLN